MKAIIICNDDDAFVKMEKVLIDAHFEIIRYRWLLKALDNIEEIQSDVVIISVLDYPRHWKTFAQYAKSGVAGKVPKIILYTPEKLSEEEEKKAKNLFVGGMFSSCNDEGLENLLNIILEENYYFESTENFSENFQEEKITSIENNTKENLQEISVQQLIFNHPKTNFIITGTILSASENKIDFAPDFPYLTNDILQGDIIEKLSYKDKTNCASCTAKILTVGESLLLELNI